MSELTGAFRDDDLEDQEPDIDHALRSFSLPDVDVELLDNEEPNFEDIVKDVDLSVTQKQRESVILSFFSHTGLSFQGERAQGELFNSTGIKAETSFLRALEELTSLGIVIVEEDQSISIDVSKLLDHADQVYVTSTVFEAAHEAVTDLDLGITAEAFDQAVVKHNTVIEAIQAKKAGRNKRKYGGNEVLGFRFTIGDKLGQDINADIHTTVFRDKDRLIKLLYGVGLLSTFNPTDEQYNNLLISLYTKGEEDISYLKAHPEKLKEVKKELALDIDQLIEHEYISPRPASQGRYDLLDKAYPLLKQESNELITKTVSLDISSVHKSGV